VTLTILYILGLIEGGFRSGTFKNVLGFDPKSVFPHQMSTFLMKLSLKVFIILPNLLPEEESLGAHSEVFNFSSTLGELYAWYHHQIRPMGVTIDLQCQQCGILRSAQVAYEPSTVTITCSRRGCKMVRMIPQSEWKVPKMKNDSGWGVKVLSRFCGRIVLPSSILLESIRSGDLCTYVVTLAMHAAGPAEIFSGNTVAW
jgi:hypothetical protein